MGELRYCVMCLADGDKEPATFLIRVGEEQVEAGYCDECAAVMRKNGHVTLPLLNRSGLRGAYKERLTQQQREEIISSTESGTALGIRYGVSANTIYNIRQKGRSVSSRATEPGGFQRDSSVVPEVSGGETVSLAFTFTEKQLDNVWSTLSLKQKGMIIQAHLGALLTE